MSKFKQYLEAVQYAKIEKDESLKERLTEKQLTEAKEIVVKIKSAEKDVTELLNKHHNDVEGFWSSFRELWFDGWKPAQSEMDRQDSEFSEKNNVYYLGVTGASSASSDEQMYKSTALQKHKVTSSEYSKVYELVDNPNTEDKKLISEVKEIRGKILLNVLDAKRRNTLLTVLGVELFTRIKNNSNLPSWFNEKKKDKFKVTAFYLNVPVKVTQTTHTV